MLKRSESVFLLFVFSLCVFLFLYNLGTPSLAHWDESWYGAISRTMFQTGNFLTPIWNTEVFFEKPPLYFWLSTLSFFIFGINEFAVRFPSAALGIGSVFLLYLWARKLFNVKVAAISALVFLSSPMFLYRARTGNLDVLLSFLMLLSAFFFWKGYKADKKWYFFMGVSIFLGFLTKGFIAFYPIVIFLLFLLIKKEIKQILNRIFLLSIFLTVLFSVSWIYCMYLLNGQIFLDQFFAQNFEKFSFNTFIQNFSFEYLFHLKSGLKIWFPFFLFSLGHGVYMSIVQRKSFILFPILFIATFLITMSFSFNKSNWYIVPLYPFIALLIGYSIYEFFKKYHFRRIHEILFLTLTIITILNLYFYRTDYFYIDSTYNDAQIARMAKTVTSTEDVLYTTNYYYPAIVYYSTRKVLAVYSDNSYNRAWWIKPKTYFEEILKTRHSTIITTDQELKDLQSTYPNEKFKVYFKIDNKIIVKNE